MGRPLLTDQQVAALKAEAKAESAQRRSQGILVNSPFDLITDDRLAAYAVLKIREYALIKKRMWPVLGAKIPIYFPGYFLNCIFTGRGENDWPQEDGARAVLYLKGSFTRMHGDGAIVLTPNTEQVLINANNMDIVTVTRSNNPWWGGSGYDGEPHD